MKSTNATAMSNAPKDGVGAKIVKSTIFATTALSLGMGLGAPTALAQEADAGFDAADIVVTARRVEERLQDVPISITVFNQEQLSNANITNTSDLAAYTPSLSANTRYGSDYSTFSIRGFSQEQRTTASVATYFAEVVTPRGGPTLSGGDGAGPGNMFDLQNVQVLNGPQGTLFGRNTTGGAVMLVPNRPTDEFGGYAEVSVGDYDMRRFQGVLNVPLSDSARLRIGMDRNEREGYTDNQSGIGPDHFSDVNYEAYRVSFVADLAPNLENYTIASYTHSLTNGTVPRSLACFSGHPFGGGDINPGPGYTSLCDLATPLTGAPSSFGDILTNQNGFYDVWNAMPDAHVSNNQWSLINTTAWDISDTLTLRNIISYAEIKNYSRSDVFGTCSNFTAMTGPLGECVTFANSGRATVFDGANQSTFSEEFQFQGTSFGDRLVWQAGAYFEESNPLAFTGSVSNAGSWCVTDTGGPVGPGWTCLGGGATPALLKDGVTPNPLAGNRTAATQNLGTVSYQTQALYAQGTYSLTDRLKLTTGYRYTWDRTDGESRMFGHAFNPATGAYVGTYCTNFINYASDPNCEQIVDNRTEAPTWTIGVDYQLSDDDMVYAKYSRGYRQGSANIFGEPGLQTFDAEQVDAYEIGAKTGFDGMFPGIFNIALFYNDLADAQLQAGFIPPGAAPTTAIINAGGITTYGAEISSTVELFEDFNVSLAYGYLNTNVDAAPVIPPTASAIQVYVTGQDLYYAPEHKVTVSASYRLPLSESVGDITLGATYAWVAEQQVSNGIGVLSPAFTLSNYDYMDEVGLLNLNANWRGMFGGPIDAALFVTNATDEEYFTNRSGTFPALGIDYGNQGAPRMVGARLKYRFGGES